MLGNSLRLSEFRIIFLQNSSLNITDITGIHFVLILSTFQTSELLIKVIGIQHFVINLPDVENITK